MLPITDFLERLKHNRDCNFSRKCDNEADDNKYNEIRKAVLYDLKEKNNLDASYTHVIQHHHDWFCNVSSTVKCGWYNALEHTILHGTYTPFDLKDFHNDVSQLYSFCEEQQLQLDETYCCCLFIKSSSKFGAQGVVIKLPSQKGIHYLESITVPESKHMSINKLKTKLKFTKKQEKIFRFHKPTSVFAQWNESPKILDVGLESDLKWTKLSKFIKSDESLREVH